MRRALILTVCVTLLGLAHAWAEEPVAPNAVHYEIDAAKVQAGVRGGLGSGLFWRWAVGAQLASGKVETRSFLVESDALFNLDLRAIPRFSNFEISDYLLRFGAFEASGSRLAVPVGVGFKGIEFGESAELSYTNLLRIGSYLFAKLYRGQNLNVDIRAGQDFERMSVALAPDTQRFMLPLTLDVEWKAGRFSGTLDATARVNGPISVEANQQVRVFSKADFEGALGLKTSYQYDAFREQFGLEPHLGIVGLYLSVDYAGPLEGTVKTRRQL